MREDNSTFLADEEGSFQRSTQGISPLLLNVNLYHET